MSANKNKQIVSNTGSQAGFSIFEMIVAMSVMTIITAGVFALMRDTMKIGQTTYEMTDAQQSLRNSQEFINRDLVNAGDGLNSITRILVPRAFVTDFLTLNPVDDPNTPGIVNLALVDSENNVPVNTPVLGTNPAVSVRSNPFRTDRISMLEIDPNFTAIALDPPAIDGLGQRVSIAAADLPRFNAGEIYFFTSSLAATFGTVTEVSNTGNGGELQFSAGDAFGLNIEGNGGQLFSVSAGGTVATSLMRMQIVHYFINSSGLLIRRVFGVSGAGFRDSVIAEHVMSLQFRFFLSPNGGGAVQPVAQLTTSAEQLSVRQVEVTVTTETPHAISNLAQQQLTMTTSTSVRNLQFRQALQPTSGQ